MFGIGPLELAFCGLVVLMVYGPEKLPGVARKVGRFVRDFKQISEAITITVRREMNNLERIAEEEEQKKQLSDTSEPVHEAGEATSHSATLSEIDSPETSKPDLTEPEHVQQSIPRE